MFALDTNASIETLRSRHPSVIARYKATDPSTIVLPIMVVAELLLGAEKSARSKATVEFGAFVSRQSWLPFGELEMREYVKQWAYLEGSGMKISGNDLIIAASVLVSGATLVTHNVREFSGVPRLLFIDWQV